MRLTDGQQAVVSIVVSAVVVYLLGSFITMSFDVREWGGIGRALAVGLWL